MASEEDLIRKHLESTFQRHLSEGPRTPSPEGAILIEVGVGVIQELRRVWRGIDKLIDLVERKAK